MKTHQCTHTYVGKRGWRSTPQWIGVARVVKRMMKLRASRDAAAGVLIAAKYAGVEIQLTNGAAGTVVLSTAAGELTGVGAILRCVLQPRAVVDYFPSPYTHQNAPPRKGTSGG